MTGSELILKINVLYVLLGTPLMGALLEVRAGMLGHKPYGGTVAVEEWRCCGTQRSRCWRTVEW
jgi:hypothetical protein